MAAAALRLRLLCRLLRAAELIALVALLASSSPRLPSAAAALRAAASLLLHPRSVFLLANAIVLLLLALYRRDPSPSTPKTHDHFLSFTTPPLLVPPTSEAPAPESEEAVFEDKQAVHVTVRAPRRSRSDKVGGGGRRGRRRAASPQLRRAESENGRRRLSTSAVTREEDAEEFRQAVEAFIAKQQTRFHREESMAFAVAVGEVSPAIASGAVAAVLK